MDEPNMYIVAERRYSGYLASTAKAFSTFADLCNWFRAKRQQEIRVLLEKSNSTIYDLNELDDLRTETLEEYIDSTSLNIYILDDNTSLQFTKNRKLTSALTESVLYNHDIQDIYNVEEMWARIAQRPEHTA
jgi:hypothetical protein